MVALVLAVIIAPKFIRALQGTHSRWQDAQESSSAGRPTHRYEFSIPASRVLTAINKELGDWDKSAMSYGSFLYDRGDLEIRFTPATSFHGTFRRGVTCTVVLQRISAAARNLAARRREFMDGLESIDSDFAELAGEGSANLVLFPSGSADAMYYIGGGFQEPFWLASYGKRNGKTSKLWRVDLALGAERMSRGVLGSYLNRRKLHPVANSVAVANSLSSRVGLAYYNANHGDGGADEGYLPPGRKPHIIYQYHGQRLLVLPEEETALTVSRPSARRH